MRALSVDLGEAVVELDLAALNSQPFVVDQIGGYENWDLIWRLAMNGLKARAPMGGGRAVPRRTRGVSIIEPVDHFRRHVG
jgi:hypothetical protein